MKNWYRTFFQRVDEAISPGGLLLVEGETECLPLLSSLPAGVFLAYAAGEWKGILLEGCAFCGQSFSSNEKGCWWINWLSMEEGF